MDGGAVAENPDSMTATWIDPTGVSWPLTDDSPTIGWFTLKGPAGWGATPYEFVTDPHPRGGETVRFIRSKANRLTWPLHVYSDNTHVEFLTRYRSIRKAFVSTVLLGKPGILRITRPDGTAREIEAYYEEGFKGEGGGEDWLSANPVLTLFCPDGYWRSTAATVETRAFTPGSNFLSPYPTVSSAQVLGDTSVNNTGDVTAWPAWTISGPASVVTATNNTTGQSFILTKTIVAGETITVTTLQPAVRGPVGENLVNALNWPDAYLWGLLPGNNEVSFSVAGASTGTSIVMSFYPRFEGA